MHRAVTPGRHIERDSIAPLSKRGKPPLESSSRGWLGRACDGGKGQITLMA